tara:strand:+ start:95 stop:688 length:594 start_codon:yes stop_codon:yes gene_type:complete
MIDNPNVVNQDSVNPNDSKQESINPNDVKQDNSDSKSEHSVPYSVFKDTKNQLNEMKTQLTEFQEQQKNVRENKMKEEGQLKELLQEKNTLIEQKDNELQEWTTYKQDKRETLLNQISENDRLIYSDLPLNKLEAHVNKSVKPISAKTSTATGQRGTAGEFGGYDNKMEWVMNDPEGYEKAKKGSGDKFGNIFGFNK